MAFYAATAPVKAADQIQHMPAMIATHDHADMGGFSVYVVHDSDPHHADHQNDDPVDEGQPDEPLNPDHHHHGDTGPNLIVPGIMAAAATALPADMHVISADRRIVGLRSIGPERPPRTTSLNA